MTHTSTLTRRTMMTSTVAGAAVLVLPLTAANSSVAAAKNIDGNQLCLSSHDWLSRRLHDVVNDAGIAEYDKNSAIKSNTCPHCATHIAAGEAGLIRAA